MANPHFFPPIEPYATGTLAVDAPHRLYWEQCGNPKGEAMLFLHGGPGAGCTGIDRRFFDPDHFRVVLLDQRGSGRWHVFGGSCGSTISLYYAQEHPERCKSLTLRGIWLLRDEEIDWFLYRLRAEESVRPGPGLARTRLRDRPGFRAFFA